MKAEEINICLRFSMWEIVKGQPKVLEIGSIAQTDRRHEFFVYMLQLEITAAKANGVGLVQECVNFSKQQIRA